MLVVAGIGLVVNIAGVWLLHSGAQESLNIQGAFLETASDALGSLGVIIAAAVIAWTHWYYADPLVSGLIGLFILPRTWNVLSQAVNVLLEATPARINIPEVKRALLQVEGVAGVHDLHVWTLTSGIDAMSGHLVLDKNINPDQAQHILETGNRLLQETFGIDHTTLQIEYHDLTAQETVL